MFVNNGSSINEHDNQILTNKAHVLSRIWALNLVYETVYEPIIDCFIGKYIK